MIPDRSASVFRWVVLALVLGAALAFLPLGLPLALGCWAATLARPMLVRVTKWLGGKERAAAVLVVVMVLIMIVPLVVAGTSLVRGAADLAKGVGQSPDAEGALREIVSGGEPLDVASYAKPAKVVELLQDHGRDAANILGTVFGAAAKAVLSLFVFVYAVFVFLVDGPDQWKWLLAHSPIGAERARRFAAAFHETGRGLFVGIGLTGLAQGLVATTAYIVLGVPRALVLGLITCVCSLIPSFGTALVWVPVTAGLALSGRTGAAIAMGVVGVGAVSTIDNLLRPAFARFGKLQLSGFVLLTSIFGGLSMFGAWGLFLGPLFARLAKEALVMAKEDEPPTPTVGPAPPSSE